jgi:glycine/D-amino acid oxidase-like deaminating enzyme
MVVAPGLEAPWWMQDALRLEGGAPAAAPPDRNLDVDVAIVGGGYVGLWTALALKARDRALRVAVLEAEICGAGPSGRNGGFCHGYWSTLAGLREMLDDSSAVRLCEAGDLIVPAVRELGEDVWLREGGLLKVATTPAQERGLDEAVEAARAVGRPAEAIALSGHELAERCRSPVFRRGVLFRDGATVHPGRLVRALRRAARAAGVELYEGTRARGRRPGLLETPGGTVRAPEIVLATNASLTDWRPIRGRLTVFGSYVVLTEPVPHLLEEIGWTGGEAITDTRVFLHYFRTTADGRVLMGSGSGPIGRGNRLDDRFTRDVPTAERAERGLRRLLPGLERARVEHAWGGPIDVSADRFPFVGTASEQPSNRVLQARKGARHDASRASNRLLRGTGGRLHYAAGFSGNGVGPSWLAGQALASLVLRVDDEWSRLPLVNRRVARVPPEPIRSLGGAAIRAAVLACEEADEDGRRAPLHVRLTADLPRVLGMRLGRR